MRPNAGVRALTLHIDYSQIFTRWVEVKATPPTGKLELLKRELHPPSKSWETTNHPAGSLKFLTTKCIILRPEVENFTQVDCI